MADFTGASLTTSEIRACMSEIESISEAFDATMDNVNSSLTTMTGQCEGGAIQKAETGVKQLYSLCQTLASCFLDIGMKIGNYLNTMLSHDSDSADALQRSIEARIYD